MRLSPTAPRAPLRERKDTGLLPCGQGGHAPHPDLAGLGSGGSAWSGRGFVSLRIDRGEQGDIWKSLLSP